MKKLIVIFVQFSLCLSAAAYGSIEKDVKAHSSDEDSIVREFLSDGSRGSLFRIGMMYYEGKGVGKDLPEAAKWFRRAAEKGDLKAKTNLGVMYLKGEGVESDKKIAYRWFSEAAYGGFALAQYYLGGMYYQGNGVRQDLIEAIKWLKKASDNGNEPATEALQILGQTVVWKEKDGDFQALLLLVDGAGKIFPNEDHHSGTMEPGNWLSMKTNDTATVALYCVNCRTDGTDHCSETVDMAVFGPDWKLYKEARNLRLYEDVLTEARHVGKSGGISMKLKLDDYDMPGNYYILATVYDHEKPRGQLIQVIMVSEKKQVDGR